MKRDNNIALIEEERSYFDYSLLLAIIALVLFGLLMIYSATSYSAIIEWNDSLHYLKRQCLGVIFGVAVAVIIFFIDYRMTNNPIWVFGFFIFSIALVGIIMYGNWIRFT